MCPMTLPLKRVVSGFTFIAILTVLLYFVLPGVTDANSEEAIPKTTGIIHARQNPVAAIHSQQIFDKHLFSQLRVITVTSLEKLMDRKQVAAQQQISVAALEQLVVPEKPAQRKTVKSVRRKNKTDPDRKLAVKRVRPAKTSTEISEKPVAEISMAQQLGLGVQRIVIDPGHGGKDPGAIGFGLQEKDIVLKVSKMAGKILKEKYKYDVTFTREDDTFLPLGQRTAIANTQNADLFLSIHVNAHPESSVKGIETYYLNFTTNKDAMRVAARENASSTHNINELHEILAELMLNTNLSESSLLAEFIQNSIVKGLQKEEYNVRNLGVKQAPFYVLVGANMPAILAEISYISNLEEAQRLKDDNYLQTIAKQLAAGVAVYAKMRKAVALQ